MKKTHYIYATALILLAACTREAPEAVGNGSLSLNVSMPGQTKAAMSDAELLANANVKIYKADFSGKVREYKYSEMPTDIYLPADEYRVDVIAGASTMTPVPVASWEQRSYAGSTSVSITAGTKSSITVAAKISNVAARVSFDSTVADQFNSGYKCTIGLSDTDASQMLEYTADKSGAVSFFLPEGYGPSLYWTFTGTLKKDGSAFIKSGRIDNVEAGKRYEMTLKYTEKNGLVVVTVSVDTSTNDKQDNIIFVPVSTGVASTGRYEIWAGHFTAHADVDEGEYDQTKVYFEYRAKGSSSWQRQAATRDSEGTYSARIAGLTGSTEYEYRLVVTSKNGGTEEVIDAPTTITTEAAPQAPNSSFETTSNDESSKYKSLYDPNSSDPTLTSKWWDNGNSGSTTVGASGVICYPTTDGAHDGSQAICLQSRYVVVKFAAGNLFSGRFGGLEGMTGGKVYFGRPFTGRPTAMRLWVKYQGGIMNNVNGQPSGVTLKKGTTPDKASLRIALGTWDYKRYGGDAQSPLLINTTKTETIWDINSIEGTVAFGERIIETGDVSDWEQITIPLNYKSETTTPTHIVISFASSMYGDYFSGYDDSHLWLDKIELLYE